MYLQKGRPLTALAGVLVLLLLCLTAGAAELTEFDQLNGKTVSMLTGAPFADLVQSKAPKVKEFTYFNNTPDMFLALKSGKTDAVLSNNAIIALADNRDPELVTFPHDLKDGVFGIAFPKGDPRREEWQRAFDAIPQATMDALWVKWTGSDEEAKVLPPQDWPGEAGTVHAAVCDTLEPMSYTGPGGELIGFDVETILLMAKSLDMKVEFTGLEFDSVLSSVQSGKADLGAGSMIVTDERREAMDFVEYYPAAFQLLTRAAKTQAQAQDTGDGLAAYRTATVAVLTGTNFGELVKARLPETQLEYFSSQADMAAALKAGKVDAIALDEPVGRYMTSKEDDLELAPERLDSQLYAFALGKQNGSLEEELSRFIREKKADGTLKALQEKWLDVKSQSAQQLSDYLDLPAVNGTLRMAVFPMPPFTIQEGELFGGYEVELAAQFCRERGYGLELMGINADGILASIQSGKCDLGGCGITITEERKESILFSEPDYEGGTVLVVAKQKAAAEEKKDFFASIRDSFERTFIREDRWQLFLQGVATTLFITILSILLGTALGFGVFLLCRKGDPIANGITRFCVWLVQGMPMVVLLMILYYVVFGKLDIPGTAVSVMAFTLVFGAAVFGMLRQGVGAVDRGQTEAAYALGYTDNRTFFRVVLPQALPHVLPFYRSEVVSTIKATAIVGYVAVMDLTKMGDLVRSRTYEAFFPLIAVAVIYFLLEALLTAVVDQLAQGVDPKERSKEEILRGVTVK